MSEMKSKKHLTSEKEMEKLRNERIAELSEQIAERGYCGGIMPSKYVLKKMTKEEIEELVNNLDSHSQEICYTVFSIDF